MVDRCVDYSIIYDLDEKLIRDIYLAIEKEDATYCWDKSTIIGYLLGTIKVSEDKQKKIDVLRKIIIKCSRRNEEIKEEYNKQMNEILRECSDLLTGFFDFCKGSSFNE